MVQQRRNYKGVVVRPSDCDCDCDCSRACYCCVAFLVFNADPVAVAGFKARMRLFCVHLSPPTYKTRHCTRTQLTLFGVSDSMARSFVRVLS